MTYENRLDMPASFGASQMPPVSTGATGWSARVTFETSKDAVADLLPSFYQLTDTPTVMISYARLSNLDWLAGRGYSLVAVHIDAIFRGKKETVQGPFSLVVWEDDSNSVVAGREYLGVPKVYADIPSASVGEESFEVVCSEYGTDLLSINFSNMEPTSNEYLERVNNASSTYHWLGWKHITATPTADEEPVPDADYPTILTQGARYDRVWRGNAEIKFFTPSFAEAPVSGRIANRLAEIPILRVGRAVASHAVDITLNRAATRRLT
ncbi:acetoacetate decarboxylase family protein [Rhodococcus sp. 5G237]